jgi:hypothetical protein
MVKLAILLALFASPAAAQSISGRVTSASTKQPVANADVIVLDQARSLVMRTPSSGNGAFSFAAPRPGNYFLRISLLGYKTSETSILAAGDSTIRVTIELQDSVLPVSGVTATGTARTRRLERIGLYDRQKARRGVYVLRDEIEQRHAQRISQLVQGQAGLRVQPVARSVASGITRGDLVMRGGMQGSMRSAYCFPRLYLDGVLARPSSTTAPTLTLDELANPEDIEAIEIYRSASQLPAEFSGADSSCGVVLIWTRTN